MSVKKLIRLIPFFQHIISKKKPWTFWNNLFKLRYVKYFRKNIASKKFKRLPITYGNQYRSLRNEVAKLTVKAEKNTFQIKKAYEKVCAKLIWKIINIALGRKI